MRSLILVAGGSGSRMNQELPKQFISLLGAPIVVHTLRKFLAFDPGMEIILVYPRKHESLISGYREQYPEFSGIKLVHGGTRRTESVKNGLAEVTGRIIGIHDAVRPLVSVDTIERCYAMAQEHGSAIPVIPVEDSLREQIADGTSRQVNRSLFSRVQTPQAFQAEKILEAYETVADQEFTDDASLYEKRWGGVTLVEGNRENIKITYPSDLKLAEALLSSPGS